MPFTERLGKSPTQVLNGFNEGILAENKMATLLDYLDYCICHLHSMVVDNLYQGFLFYIDPFHCGTLKKILPTKNDAQQLAYEWWIEWRC